MKNFVYAFMYNDCTPESSWATISLHYTKKGAEKAMKAHKAKKRNEFNRRLGMNNELGFKFGEFESWCVEQIKILP